MAECRWQSNCLDMSLASVETPYDRKIWHDGDGRQLKLQIVGHALIRFSWKWGINSIMGNIISELWGDFTQGHFACTSSCSWILFPVLGKDIDCLHYFCKSLLMGTFLSWILKHAVVKSTIWVNFFFTHYNGHWLQKTITTKSRNPST